MVSTDIRRDLLAPMHAYSRLDLVHFYRRAPYGDLTPQDLATAPGRLIACRSTRDLVRRLEHVRPAILQTVEILALRQFPTVAAITRFARRTGTPLVAGVHMGRPVRDKYGRVLAAALRVILRPTVEAAALFFCVNDGARRNLLWLGVPERKVVRLMYGTWGIDPQAFTPVRNGHEPAWPPDTLLFVGRIDAEKGIDDLLRAFQIVRDQVPGARLEIVGAGPAEASAQAWVRDRGLQGTVTFHGTIKHRDLPPYFRAAAVFVSPAVTTRRWEEYVGMTNIQAMGCGIPVVSTRSGAIPEYVPPEAGILVPERDPAALADALARLLEDDGTRRAMGQAGRAHAVAHYDARQNVIAAESLLLERVLG